MEGNSGDDCDETGSLAGSEAGSSSLLSSVFAEAGRNRKSQAKEGSTESIYEAVKKPNLKEALPKNHNSCESLTCKAEWDSSDPSDKHQTVTRSKGENSRSYPATLMLENETFAGNESGVLTRQVQEKETVSERNRMHLITEHSDLLTDSNESSQTVGRLKKLQKLVPLKTSPQNDGDNDGSTAKKHDCLVEGIRRNRIALTCISLSGMTEKSSYKAAAASEPLQLPENTRSSNEDPIEGELWIPKIGHYRLKPFERPEAWPPCQHICQQNPDGLCIHDGNSSFLSWNSDWDRFESLIQELDRRQSDLSLSHIVRPPADLQPLKIPEKETGLKSEGREMETSQESGPNYINISPEKTQAAQNSNEAVKREADHRRTCTKGHRRSRNSIESLYSLKSGQSSSSGVTSGSNCSSNRESLRLEDEPTFTGQFCCQARVHTEFVPSPYDTESLTLKVGDVIDVIAKPPIGIWTGSLNGRIGNFKFIYVDVLTHSSGPNLHKVGQKSMESSSALQLSGYQTVDDLMTQRASGLMQLNVTDPEERERLIAAVSSLQQLHSDSLLENEARLAPETSSEDKTGDINNPRDSGCLMAEDSEPHSLSEYAAPSEIKVS